MIILSLSLFSSFGIFLVESLSSNSLLEFHDGKKIRLVTLLNPRKKSSHDDDDGLGSPITFEKRERIYDVVDEIVKENNRG